MRRVVVTGISVVSPLGCEISEFWDRLWTGKSGVVPLRRFDVDGFKVRFGGEIYDFDPADHLDLPPKELRRLDRFTQFGLVAAVKAVRQSGSPAVRGRFSAGAPRVRATA